VSRWWISLAKDYLLAHRKPPTHKGDLTMSGKPKSMKELEALVDQGLLSIQLVEDCDDGTTHLMVLDNRQEYENEVYEVWV